MNTENRNNENRLISPADEVVSNNNIPLSFVVPTEYVELPSERFIISKR